MIALCLQHHKEADVGTFSNEQLLRLKQNPQSQSTISGRFNWKREETLTIAGSNYFVGTPTILQIGTQKLIWLEKDDNGFDTLNLDLHASDGNLVFQMRQNDWIALPENWEDIESAVSANRLSLRSKFYQVSLDISFSYLDMHKLRTLIASLSKDYIKESVKDHNSRNSQMPLRLISPKTYSTELQAEVDRVMNYVSENFESDHIQVCKIHLKIEHPFSLKVTQKRFKASIQSSVLELSNCLMGSATVLHIDR